MFTLFSPFLSPYTPRFSLSESTIALTGGNKPRRQAMFEAEREEELVRVPVRRIERREEKALELENPLPIDPQQTWEMPRRWRVY